MSRLSVDIGGTFTDVVLEHAQRYTTTKVLTTYDDPARGVMAGIREVLALADVTADQITSMLHGTTLATNALIERRGAVTGMLTTAGHRDVIEMAFENRFEQYDVNIDRPQPLVPRHLRLPVTERVAADGDVLVELDLDSVRSAVETLLAAKVTSVAVCLLHSYRNTDLETQIDELLNKEYPELSVSLSSAVCPEIREYERFSTTVANAYVQPLMATYLNSLKQQVRQAGITADILLMTSGGGLTTLDAAATYPIRLVESGPAGGAMLAAQLAREMELAEVLSFDMGGTTAKICLIDDGQPQQSRAFEVDRSYRFKKGSGLPLRIPVVEMVEIGAGGGSIAQVDDLGRLHVGPASAGSEPGPACYGRGGQAATVTDADLVLGKLSAGHFAGGRMQLKPERAEQAMAEALGGISGNVAQQAFAVNEIVEENMASAARSHAAEWGRDLPQRCLFAFGGAAPLHAVGLADKLKISRVFIPQGAGVGSAIGFLLAPVRYEVVRSQVVALADLETAQLAPLFTEMYDEASAILTSARAGQPWHEQIHAYMRYAGQGYEIAVPTDRSLINLKQAFEQTYTLLYGRTIPSMPIEILSWTLALASPMDAATPEVAVANTPLQPARMQQLFDGQAMVEVPVYTRPLACFDEVLTGPAIVVEDQTTTVIAAGWQGRCLRNGGIMLEKQDGTA